jgi:ketosteroid isomerase-like protein
MGDSDGVRQVLMDFVDAMNRGDGEAAARLHSSADDALTIGSDPDEWFEGAAASEVFTQQGGGGEGGLQVRVEEPVVGAAGDVGWYAGRGAFVTPDGKEHAFRASGVLRREGGEWKILQSHTSIGVPNEEALGG